MKVTRLIKEYVAEQVTAKYPETEDEKLYKEKLDKIQDKIEELEEKIKSYAAVLCEEANKEFGIEDWEEDDKIHLYDSRRTILSSGWNNPYIKECSTLKNDRNKKISDTIKNILVNLELGATKAELDEMLKKLGEED